MIDIERTEISESGIVQCGRGGYYLLALGTRAAASPSTAMVKVLDLKATAEPESSVVLPIAKGIAPSALNDYSGSQELAKLWRCFGDRKPKSQ